MGNLIWAFAVFVPLMTLVLGTLKPLRRALDRMADAYGQSDGEREASATERLADAEGRRADIAVRAVVLDDEAARERARLKAETEQYEVDAKAARLTLEAATAARVQALTARGQAEADLAPDLVRRSMMGSPGEGNWLAHAYESYCQNLPQGERPMGLDQWVGDFEGLASLR